MRRRTPDWYQILVVARQLASQEPHQFTSAELAAAAGLTGTKKSSAIRIASAICSKFEKWGYLAQVDTVPSTGRSWNVWTVTDQGMQRPAPKKKRTFHG